MHRINLTDNHFYQIRLLTALASLCLSIFTYYGSNINNDGILYISTAEAYLESGLAKIIVYNPWPFFSIMIAYIHKATFLSFETVAYAVNGLLFILLLDTLLLISKKILPDYKKVAIAAIVLACFHSFNEYREFIIRDFGYWAFFSLALYRFMTFIEKPTLRNATYWQLAVVTAFLFRIEGIVIVLGLPLYLFILHTPKTAFIRYIQLNYLLIIGVIPAMLVSTEIPDIFFKAKHILLMMSNISVEFNDRVSIIATQVLDPNAAKYSTLILSASLVSMLVFKIIKAMSFSYIGLFIISCWQGQPIYTSPYQGLIRYLVALSTIPLIVFVFSHYFISTRYTMTILISLLLLMLPRLTQMIEQAWISNNKLLLGIVGTVFLANLIDGTTSSRPKPYLKEVAIWASDNLPKNSAVLTNNNIIEYYYQSRQAGAKINYNDSIENIRKNYQRYDHLIIFKKRKDTQVDALLTNMKLVQIYCQGRKRSGEVCIYRTLPN